MAQASQFVRLVLLDNRQKSDRLSIDKFWDAWCNGDVYTSALKRGIDLLDFLAMLDDRGPDAALGMKLVSRPAVDGLVLALEVRESKMEAAVFVLCFLLTYNESKDDGMPVVFDNEKVGLRHAACLRVSCSMRPYRDVWSKTRQDLMASPPAKPPERLSVRMAGAVGALTGAASSSLVPEWDAPFGPADQSEVPASMARVPVGAALPSDHSGCSSPPSDQCIPFGASASPFAAGASAFDSTDSGTRVAPGSKPATPSESAKSLLASSSERGRLSVAEQAPRPPSDSRPPPVDPSPLGPPSCGGGRTGCAAAAESGENLDGPACSKRRCIRSDSPSQSSSSASPLPPGPGPRAQILYRSPLDALLAVPTVSAAIACALGRRLAVTGSQFVLFDGDDLPIALSRFLHTHGLPLCVARFGTTCVVEESVMLDSCAEILRYLQFDMAGGHIAAQTLAHFLCSEVGCFVTCQSGATVQHELVPQAAAGRSVPHVLITSVVCTDSVGRLSFGYCASATEFPRGDVGGDSQEDSACDVSVSSGRAATGGAAGPLGAVAGRDVPASVTASGVSDFGEALKARDSLEPAPASNAAPDSSVQTASSDVIPIANYLARRDAIRDVSAPQIDAAAVGVAEATHIDAAVAARETSLGPDSGADAPPEGRGLAGSAVAPSVDAFTGSRAAGSSSAQSSADARDAPADCIGHMASVEGDAGGDGDGEAGESELVHQALELGYFCVTKFLQNCGLISQDAQLELLGLSDHAAIACAVLTAVGEVTARVASVSLLEEILVRLATCIPNAS